MLYKYPQAAFPYGSLVEENRRRGKDQPEYELFDTGVFADDRYFDVQVEYAKAGPSDTLLLVTVFNRGPEAAAIHVLPQLWFRNTWSWTSDTKKPSLHVDGGAVVARHEKLGEYRLYADGSPALVFCENETNSQRIFGFDAGPGFFKDGINEFVVNG